MSPETTGLDKYQQCLDGTTPAQKALRRALQPMPATLEMLATRAKQWTRPARPGGKGVKKRGGNKWELDLTTTFNALLWLEWRGEAVRTPDGLWASGAGAGASSSRTLTGSRPGGKKAITPGRSGRASMPRVPARPNYEAWSEL